MFVVVAIVLLFLVLVLVLVIVIPLGIQDSFSSCMFVWFACRMLAFHANPAS